MLLIPPLLNPNFRGVPGRCTRSPMLGVNYSLFGHEIIFEEFQPAYLITVPERHRRTDTRTDRRTTCNLITALCVASSGKNRQTWWTAEALFAAVIRKTAKLVVSTAWHVCPSVHSVVAIKPLYALERA